MLQPGRGVVQGELGIMDDSLQLQEKFRDVRDGDGLESWTGGGEIGLGL